MTKPVKTISPQELADMLHNSKLRQGEDYVVVDVRDADYVGGNIPKTVHIPYHDLSSDPKADIGKHPVLTKARQVIFLCALSKLRGPKAAVHLAKGLSPDQQVWVLRGGFNEWQSRFRDQPDLLENYDSKLWQEEWWQS